MKIVLAAIGAKGRGKRRTETYGSDIRQFGEMLDADRLATNDPIDLLLDLAVRGRVLQEVVKGKRQQPRRCLVASDQKGDELVRDVVVVQLLARCRVRAVQHGTQEIFAGTRVLLAAGDDFVRRLLHNGNVVGVLFVGGAVEEVGRKGGPLAAAARLGQEVAHGTDEGVQFLVVEGVEAIVHGTQGQCVQSKAREVV